MIGSQLLSVALAVLASAVPLLSLAQVPVGIYSACVAAAADAGAKQQCKAQRDLAVAALRQSITKAGIALQPDARMIDEYQRTGRWDLMRALQLSHGRRVPVQDEK